MSNYNAHVTVGNHGELLPTSRVTVDGIAAGVTVPARDPLTSTDLFWDRVASALHGLGLAPAADSWRDHEIADHVAHFHAVPKGS
jgi:hypothetical protein